MRRPALLVLPVLVGMAMAACTTPPSTGAGATSGSSISTGTPAESASPPGSVQPVPAPTGPPMTAALAKAPHFLLFVGGSLSDQAVTRIEGRDIDGSGAVAVLRGVPTDTAPA